MTYKHDDFYDYSIKNRTTLIGGQNFNNNNNNNNMINNNKQNTRTNKNEMPKMNKGESLQKILAGLQAELEAALNNLPPVMTPIEAAMLLRLKLSTLYRHVSEGKYSSAVKRGKPLALYKTS